MDDQRTNIDTPAWIFQVWASFIIAVGSVVYGVYSLPVGAWERGFMGLGVFFTIASSFTLAKTLRDNHEARRLINRVKSAKTTELIRNYETADSE